jgi:hypothetical protein
MQEVTARGVGTWAQSGASWPRLELGPQPAPLAGRCHAVGDAFGIVDAKLKPFYRWGGRIGLVERLAERPAVRRVIECEEVSLWP